MAVVTEDSKEFTSGYSKYVLAVLFVIAIVNFLDRQILSILQEPIKEEFGLSDSQVGLLSFAFTLLYVGFALPVARLADVTVRRTTLAVCVAGWSAMTALCGVAQSFWHLTVARAGVGAAEAGAAPLCHSLIADYFPAERRATAISTYALGIPVGIMLGMVIGGAVATYAGWRAAFLVVGIPGILLALLVYLTVKEPPRGLSDNVSDDGETPKLLSVFAHLWTLKSFRHLTLAAGLQSMVAYGMLQWMPSFFVRVHNYSLQEVGFTMGPLLGVAGLIGTLGSGILADRLAKRDRRWYLWICALAMAIASPFAVAALLSPSPTLAFAFFFVPLIMANAFIGITGAVVQSLAPLRMRAMAAATKTLILNLIGIGLGPFVVGFLSDVFNQGDSGEGLRTAILCLISINLWAAIHYIVGARTLGAELDQTHRLNSGDVELKDALSTKASAVR